MLHTLQVPNDSQLLEAARLQCRVGLIDMGEDFWKAEDIVPYLKETLMSPNGHVMAVEDEREVVGLTIGLLLKPKELEEKAGSSFDHVFGQYDAILYIDKLMTDPSHRRNGIGRALTLALIEWAKVTHTVSKVLLRAERSSMPARALYGSIGFADTGVIDKNHPSRSYMCLNIVNQGRMKNVV